ncbi:MAG: FGGY-family carbohydrate kinase [Pseudorhizobium sp.]
MNTPQHVAVIDIGKTNAKVALVDVAGRREVAVRRQPNRVIGGPPYPHYDTDRLWAFILTGLTDLHAAHGVDALVVTTHGAAAALVDAAGKLAAPVLDYEWIGPNALARDYDCVRPPFSETGSARLPMGLNIGAQLFWQFNAFPEIRRRTETIVTYPQYWVLRLTGTAVNEATSLGCHTDLWRPRDGRFSTLVEQQGWLQLMAPVAKAYDVIGPVLPQIAATTKLAADTPVICGIHDSNASLYAHLAWRTPPFAVVSTGTWVISMAVGGSPVTLDPELDTLLNVNALGDPVPTARFMGGREFDRLMAGSIAGCTADDIGSVLRHQAMLLPSVESHSGPFPGRHHSWSVDQSALSDGRRYAVVSFYLALMTAAGLVMTGAAGEILVEGPFADNQPYLDMLASASGLPVFAATGTGTSIGAALLAIPREGAGPATRHLPGHVPQQAMANYAARWRACVTACARQGAGYR